VDAELVQASAIEPCNPHNPQWPQITCQDDWDNLVPEFCRDVDAVLSCHNLGVLLAAGGVSYLVHETLDDDVADSFERHPNRWGKGQEFFAAIGNPSHHFAAIGGLYLYSVHTQDAELHDLSKALFNAVSITGLTTIALKATIGTNTTAPNDEPDPFGGAWPSGHTSSTFAFAAVLDEYYGPKVGIPAYLLAGLAGWERIDDGEHDLSDVVFGAVLGYVIGKTVAAEHHVRFWGMEMQPLVDPCSGTTGLCLERRF
jgi:membrane-associated phospholipid phosphatase